MPKAPAKTATVKKPRGGARPGAGKKKGSKNKRTIYKEMLKAEILGTPLLPPLPGDAEETNRKKITAVQYFEAVLNNPKMPESYKMEAAKALAPYQSPKLATVTVKGDSNNPLRNVNTNVTPEQFRDMARDVLKEI